MRVEQMRQRQIGWPTPAMLAVQREAQRDAADATEPWRQAPDERVIGPTLREQTRRGDQQPVEINLPPERAGRAKASANRGVVAKQIRLQIRDLVRLALAPAQRIRKAREGADEQCVNDH